VVVVAPLENHSGASAAVGTVYERDSIAYRKVVIEGAEAIPTYGLDASPALSVIVGALGAFGPRPDIVVSGINAGVNVGRSVLHSGTVGAVLTGAQLGLNGLAVSLRSGGVVNHWETAADLAVGLVEALDEAPAGTVWNLNVPSLAPEELLGLRLGRISNAGIIKSASETVRVEPDHPSGDGAIRLTLGAAVPSLGDVRDEAPEDDGALVAAGYASLTPIVGVRADTSAEAQALVTTVLAGLEPRR
jgi:5'-nucleotidase